MSTEYSVLDDRPLDHWKVTELKEELRRRKLTTKGLKEDLIKRLDEAVRIERGLAKKDQEKVGNSESQPNHQESNPNVLEKGVGEIDVIEHPSGEKHEPNVLLVDINSVTEAAETEILADEPVKTIDLKELAGERTDHAAKVVDDSVMDHRYDASEMNSEHGVVVPENKDSEVSPDLGLEVKCVSISTDSVSLSDNIELKDDLNVNNVHLEDEPLKPDGGGSQLLDINEEPADSKPALGEGDVVNEQSALGDSKLALAEEDENAKKIEVSVGGSPEKLNLDRSSGDESMDEDVLETKHVQPCGSSIQEGGLKGVRDLHVVTEEVSVDIEGEGFSPEKKDVVSEGEIRASVDKRKAENQGSVGTAEPVKRQRRWNSESINIPDKAPGPTTPKQAPGAPTTPKLDTVSPKERVVPPSQKTPTTSLRIDHFVRPFTLKAVQELLAKTGTVSSFWMDHIKTHCYVTYATADEAEATRNAVYNLQWPPNGGRLLVADFVDPEEVKIRVESPSQPSVPTTPTAGPGTAIPFDRPPAAPVLVRPPLQALSVPAAPTVVREKPLPPPPPPPPPPELPVLTLDDLFKKTTAPPRIYYLPLTDEQVKAKAGVVRR